MDVWTLPPRPTRLAPWLPGARAFLHMLCPARLDPTRLDTRLFLAGHVARDATRWPGTGAPAPCAMHRL